MSVFFLNGPASPARYAAAGQAAFCLLLAGVFTMGRAYQTDDMQVLMRASLWLLVITLIVVQFLCLRNLLHRVWNHDWAASTLSLFGTTALLALELDLLKYTPLLPKAHDPYFEFVVFLLPMVLLVSGGAFLIQRIALRLASTEQPPVATAVLTIQAQEHYLLVTTDGGQEIRRGRMRDCVAELAGCAGQQVHRSWWVADAAVAGVTRLGRDYVVHLKEGGTVPVARSRVKNLRAAGWI